jgi:transcriptional regulator with XRE-family HTH domain
MPNCCQEALPYCHSRADIQAVPKSQHVLHRHDLAQKLAQAMRLRKRSQADVAREFGVSRPTVSSDWLKEGRIAKKHLPHLVEYFELPYEWWLTNAVAAQDVFAYRRDNLIAIVGEELRRTA